MKKRSNLIKEIKSAMKNGILSGRKTATRQQGSSLSLRMTKTVSFQASKVNSKPNYQLKDMSPIVRMTQRRNAML